MSWALENRHYHPSSCFLGEYLVAYEKIILRDGEFPGGISPLEICRQKVIITPQDCQKVEIGLCDL